MEKRNGKNPPRFRGGLMETLLRRRDPGGDALFDLDEDTAGEEEGTMGRLE
ncbi:MAG: hypothetical protein IK099_05485 [Clostridia bacterium]|nr:hypothetical protein [Clostridia bacterium]